MIESEVDPISLYEKLRKKHTNTVLLESMDPPSQFAKQSVICFEPSFMIKIENEKLFFDNKIKAYGLKDIMSVLRKLLSIYKVKSDSQIFQGGLVGFTSYNFVHYLEDISKFHESQFPDGLYGFYLDGVIFDHVYGETYYFYHDSVNSKLSELLDQINTDVEEQSKFSVLHKESDVSQIEFETSVKQIRELIIQGEIFQTVISQSMTVEIEGDRFAIYTRLREVNPSPYMYCLEFGEISIIGSSPELLISCEKNKLTTYPIAGTRPYAKTEEERIYNAYDLISDEKEIAEHNMLVDLARNDIGRVSEYGTVKVEDYMKIGVFSHVIHIVSKVTGKLRNNLDMFDAFLAVFPAGTVTGAPKVRSMKIISELEKQDRGPYAGSVGFFDISGNMEQAISIRTAFGIGTKFKIQAGAGIVLDSDPTSEYMETINKLGAFLQIFEMKIANEAIL